ncbi:Unknown protein sequence [Pseudomonas caricapapayae]|nr:Unknown protein sequence [Pseudomonas caricapapayae]
MFADAPRPLLRRKSDVKPVVSRIEQEGFAIVGTASPVTADLRVCPDDAAQMAIGG